MGDSGALEFGGWDMTKPINGPLKYLSLCARREPLPRIIPFSTPIDVQTSKFTPVDLFAHCERIGAPLGAVVNLCAATKYDTSAPAWSGIQHVHYPVSRSATPAEMEAHIEPFARIMRDLLATLPPNQYIGVCSYTGVSRPAFLLSAFLHQAPWRMFPEEALKVFSEARDCSLNVDAEYVAKLKWLYFCDANCGNEPTCEQCGACQGCHGRENMDVATCTHCGEKKLRHQSARARL